MRILAIDQGTSNTKALVVDGSGHVLARASRATVTHYPHPGWAEQSAGAIWLATRQAIDAVATEVGPETITALAIANQRETLVTWDAATSAPVAPAILWQCRRTATDCAALSAAGHNETVEGATGLAINPLFPATKLAWVLREVPQARALLAQGRLRAGTVDAWLLWNLTGGTCFATDHSNASRTQLYDTETLTWSAGLSEIFGADVACLPQALPSDSRFGDTAEETTLLPAGVPIHAMMGDSHAALYGHGIRVPGIVKATYGTGSSLMALTPERSRSHHGLSSTIAWSDQNGPVYALEGNITVSAQAAAFMATLLGMTGAAELSDLAQSAPHSGGVVFVPALAGLGAPHWNDSATGLVTGMTHGTLPAHLARATFEAIALQIADVFTAMSADASMPLNGLRADGGASSNTFLMQLQADVLGQEVAVCAVEDVGALGAAVMAAAALGHTLELPKPGRVFSPSKDRDAAQKLQSAWRAALRKSVC